MPGLRLIPSLLAVCCLAAPGGLGAQTPTTTEDTIQVPGGAAAVARLLGYVETNPRSFLVSLNRVLLDPTNPKHDWEELPKRRMLVDFLRTVEVWRRELGGNVELALRDRAGRRRVERLFRHAGYRLRGRGDRITVTPREDDRDAMRRRVASALGWDLSAAYEALARGETVTLEIPVEAVAVPDSLALWAEVRGQPIPASAGLATLARDQRLGLVLEGLRRAGPSTTDFLRRTVGLHWIYQKVPFEILRYGAAIEVRAGRLSAPGGTEAESLWGSLAGAPFGSSEFVHRLFERRSGRLLYLWKALRFAPTAQRRYYLGLDRSAEAGRRSFLKGLFNRLDNAAMRGFDSARDETDDFATLVRSLPLRPEGSAARGHGRDAATEGGLRLDLPGGPGLWYQALKGNAPVSSAQRLARAARRGDRRAMSEQELLLRTLTEKTDLGPIEVPVLPRLLRTTNLFLDRSDLLTPENVVAISRGLDRYPGAFGILDAFPFEEPETVAAYLLAVDHLSGLPSGVEQELLLAQFQGGVEWIGLLARGGRADAAHLEERLRAWASIHGAASRPDDAAAAQLAWIERLLQGLPRAPDAGPGRGDLERRWLAALVASPKAESFEWAGLRYVGHGHRRRLDGMARHLERQGVPSVDDLLAVTRNLDRLMEAAETRDATSSLRLAERTREIVRSWPASALRSADLPRPLPERILPLGRPRLMELLNLARSRKGRRLARLADDLAAAKALLAQEIRLSLLAPIYVSAMGASDSLLYNDPDLVRKHLVTADLKPYQSPWEEARSGREPDLGFHLVGSLSSVPLALAVFRLEETVGATQVDAAATRYRYWLQDSLSAPWDAISPELSRLVAVLVEAGAEVSAHALEELPADAGVHLDAVALRVPYGRLERHARDPKTAAGLSPSEHFLIGLGALAGDFWGPPRQELVAPETRAAFEEAASALGPDWRRRLDVVGAATPQMDGRGRRHVSAWPPYEALDRQTSPVALQQRELLDLRIAVVTALGRDGLPGSVGADLSRELLAAAAADLRQESPDDWESFVTWVGELDDSYFQGLFRRCLEQGLYSLAS